MAPNDPEIEFSLWPPKVRGKGRLAVVGGIIIAALLIVKADLPAWETWTQLASRW